MRRSMLALCAALAIVPTAAAVYTPYLGGEISVSALTAGILPCDERDVLAFLEVRWGEIPEEADFTLDADTSCGAPVVAFGGRLESWGWRLGDGEVTRGALRYVSDVEWHLHLETKTCPASAPCLVPLIDVTYEGPLGPVYTPQ